MNPPPLSILPGVGFLSERHEDRHIIAINKPPGLPSTGKTLQDPNCAQHLLAQHLGPHTKIWAVHQLDRDTSGINLFVRRKSFVHTTSERLRTQGRKTYLALCHGPTHFNHTHHSSPIHNKHAQSIFHTLASSHQHSLLEITLLTGRTHQIRIHLNELGHPLLGERRYHPNAPCTRAPRHMLHAWSITWTQEHETWTAPIPADLTHALQHSTLTLSDTLRNTLFHNPNPTVTP